MPTPRPSPQEYGTYSKKQIDQLRKPKNRIRYYKHTQPTTGFEPPGGSKRSYLIQKEELINNPDKILEIFHTCYKVNKNGCWWWTLTTHTGNTAVGSRVGNAQYKPRFGTGKLSPYRTSDARRYIYQITFPDKTLEKHARLYTSKGCAKLCVNPHHLLTTEERRQTTTQHL